MVNEMKTMYSEENRSLYVIDTFCFHKYLKNNVDRFAVLKRLLKQIFI